MAMVPLINKGYCTFHFNNGSCLPDTLKSFNSDNTIIEGGEESPSSGIILYSLSDKSPGDSNPAYWYVSYHLHMLNKWSLYMCINNYCSAFLNEEHGASSMFNAQLATFAVIE